MLVIPSNMSHTVKKFFLVQLFKKNLKKQYYCSHTIKKNTKFPIIVHITTNSRYIDWFFLYFTNRLTTDTCIQLIF